MLIFPSRGRPHLLARFFEGYQRTGAELGGVILLDEGDAEKYGDVPVPSTFEVHVDKRKPLGQRYNELFQRYPNESFYGQISDDSIPDTKYWDVLLAARAIERGITWPSDGLHNRCSMPFVSGDVIRKIGFIAPLGLKHLYIDNFYEEIALALNINGYSPDIRIRHLHFSNGAPMDKTYEERQLEGDAEAWQAFVNNGLLDTIKRVVGDVSSPPSNNLQHTGHVTFVCVQTNNYDGCGHRYVNNLYRMLKENSNYPVELVCFTDKSDGIKSGIKVRQLPSDMDGWWGKLYMFKRHLFPDGTRLCFLDLDTLILKNVDELRKYSGKFATLRDFFYPTQIGPGIILWEAGEYTSSIWEEWVSQGKLKHDGGDLWWLNTLDQGRFAKDADKLQDVFPGMFCSYKADDITDKPDVPVVCFHGRPKQTDFPPDHWVSAVWNG